MVDRKAVLALTSVIFCAVQLVCQSPSGMVTLDEMLNHGLGDEHRVFAISAARVTTHEETPLTIARYG